MDILALLQNTYPTISRKNVRRLSRIIKAMLAMTGRVTMLGLSRWGGKGCSYRTVQRFFGEPIPWVQLYWQTFISHLYRSEREYLLGGDECVVTKSGKHTYGLDHFFSGLLSKVVPSIAIFALSLIDVEERRSYPVRVEQVIRSEAEKAAAKAKKEQRKAKQKAQVKGKPGRPKGSKNRDKTQVELTEELLRIQKDGQTTVGHLPGRAFDPLSGAGWTLWQQQRSSDGASVWSAPGLQTAS